MRTCVMHSLCFIFIWEHCDIYNNFCNATANNDAAEDENVSELAIHYMKENMEKHLSLQDIADRSDILLPTSPCCSKRKQAIVL